MAKDITYYQRKIKKYQKLEELNTPLKSYFYFLERYYYNDVYNSIEYKEFYNIYKIVFDELTRTMEELEIEHIEEIDAYVCFLLEKGYLAYDINMPYESHTIQTPELRILPAFTLNKHSKCRHNSALLRDLILYKNNSAYILGGIQEDLSELLGHKKKINTPNHAIIVAEDKNYSYLLDPSTGEVYNVISDKEIFSNILSRFCLYTEKFTSLDDEIFFELLLSKPNKSGEEVVSNINRCKDYLKKNKKVFIKLNEKITEPLKDAEKIYRRIIN